MLPTCYQQLGGPHSHVADLHGMILLTLWGERKGDTEYIITARDRRSTKLTTFSMTDITNLTLRLTLYGEYTVVETLKLNMTARYSEYIKH